MIELMQDYNYKLFAWFASRLDARRLIKENCARIHLSRTNGVRP